MSRIFDPIRQNDYVVRDIEAALKHWTTVLEEPSNNTDPSGYLQRAARKLLK
ncbi:MAG TPA: hypothetical protein VFM05_01715 [Candidatus Saccharimonadales bacterium]|nr:hypothetical protein [Candidatus Saccharimonadales bacterium]